MFAMHNLDVLWLDFDIYLFQDPVKHIKTLVPDPELKGVLDFEKKKRRNLPLTFANVPETSHHPDEPIGFDTDSVEDIRRTQVGNRQK